MRTADFDFDLPPALIAQQPLAERDQSRLMVVHRAAGMVEHRKFTDIVNYIQPGDVLVLNDSRVIPARLRGRNVTSGGKFEMLLLEENAPNDWWAMLKPGRRGTPGTQINIFDLNGRETAIIATVQEANEEGHRRLVFSGVENILTELDRLGEVPLPPYIARPTPQAVDKDRYQTVFAREEGSVAAPTAGLHFTPTVLENIVDAGARICHVTLHVGPGTFAPVKADDLAGHIMHEERYELSESTAQIINARPEGARIIAVGTTSMRVLESVAEANNGKIVVGKGRTRIFIYPPHAFKCVDAMLTNFHLPCSTLLMLVSAFMAPGESRGREKALALYQDAIHREYRFFSYGDAMLII